MNPSYDVYFNDPAVQPSLFQFPTSPNLSHGSIPFSSEYKLNDVEPSIRRNNRHKRTVSISMSPAQMAAPYFLTETKQHIHYTYSTLSQYLGQPDQHIVFEQTRGYPHIVISLPEDDPWIDIVHWLMGVDILEPESLVTPSVYHGPEFLPGQPSEDYLDKRPVFSSQKICPDPGASLLLAAQNRRDTHIDDSLDPSRSPHIIIQEAPPLDPQVKELNMVEDQDLQYGRQLAVPNRPSYNEPEDEYFEYYEDDDILDGNPIEIPERHLTPEEFYAMRTNECEHSEDLEHDDPMASMEAMSRPDSPLPQTPDDEDLDLPSFEPWHSYREPFHLESDHESDVSSIDDGSPSFETSAAIWKAGMEESLPECYRLDEDDEELPSLDGSW